MKHLSPNIRLLLVFLVSLGGSLIIFLNNQSTIPLSHVDEMNEAKELAQNWFNTIDSIKSSKNIQSDVHSNVPNNFMIGNDWSYITTSLGSLEAKEISTNPDFAALTYRLLKEAGIESGDTIGIILSGSFPSIAVSVLAAVQTMNLETIIISSLGSSTFGANQPEASWIDIENWLATHAELKYRSDIVSMGADSDNGSDLFEEGKVAMNLAAERNRVELYKPESLEESIQTKTELLLSHHIDLLINIGGNMAAMGACSHSLSIPNGLNDTMTHCSDSLRGIVSRVSENQIPFIQYLYLKELAIKYGMDIAPGNKYHSSSNLYQAPREKKLLNVFIFIFCILPLWYLRKPQ